MDEIIKNLRNLNIGIQLIYSLAVIMEKMGSLKNALRLVEKAITNAPNNQKLNLQASRLYLRKGQLDKAAMCWEKAVGQENLGVFFYWINSYWKKTHTEHQPYTNWWSQQRQTEESYDAQFTNDY
jgi:tetratricopeptide (TPR) repeat protein